tara:strand:+ start:126 stop:1208 length:1083 start_codon:yes stop_codon:yes gene_type:complete
MKKNKTAFVTFFPIQPNTMGSSTVVNSRFDCWPHEKKIFQISHLKKINNKKIETIFINNESPINKIFKLPEVIFKINRYFNNTKKKLIIIEGASWIFYSFIIIFFFKFFQPKVKIIYISHSIESEIRKKYSNIFIYFLTKFLERLVFRYADLSTSVSLKERKKIKSLYNRNTILLPNGITLNEKKMVKKNQNNYIIYTGSYLYKPNKDAIDYLNNYIMPVLLKKIPNLKLMLTGGGFNKKYSWIVNKGIVTKNELYNYIYFSKCLCVPLKFGSGTRIKILEALCLGAIVISSKKGIEGIDIISKRPPFIIDKKTKLIKEIFNIIKNYNELKKKSERSKKFYLEKYSMEKIVKKFVNENKI